MNTQGTCTIPGANRTGIPLPTKPVGRPEDDIVARIERAHSRPSSSPFTRDAPEFTAEQLIAAGFAVKIDGRKRTDRVRDAKIRELYVEDGMSVREVAASVGMSPAGVRGAMDRLGITPRAQGRNTRPRATKTARKATPKTPAAPKPMGAPRTVHIDKAELTALYVTRGLSCRATAERLGVSTITVRRALHRYGIEIRTDRAALTKGVSKALTDLLDAHGLSLRDVRTWARANGHKVGTQGSIGRPVIEAYLLHIRHFTTTTKEISA